MTRLIYSQSKMRHGERLYYNYHEYRPSVSLWPVLVAILAVSPAIVYILIYAK